MEKFYLQILFACIAINGFSQQKIIIFFESNKSEISSNSKNTLDSLSIFLKYNAALLLG